MKARFRSIFSVFLIFLGLIALIAWEVSGMLTRFAITVPTSSKPNVTPAMLGLPFETRHAVSSDGIHLAAWWIPSSGGGAPIIIIHGLGASKEFMIGFIALAHADGHPALVVDLRGHGESDPSPTTLGGREPLDITAWIAQLRQEGYPHPILWGISLGAVTALRAAAGDPGVGGVIADAPFDRLAHTMAVHARLYFGLPPFPLLYLTEWRMERQLHFRIAEVDSFQAVRQLRVPLMVIAAERDRRMSLDSVKAIYEAAHEPKWFYISPGEDHETRLFKPEFRDQVSDFFRFCEASSRENGKVAPPQREREDARIAPSNGR